MSDFSEETLATLRSCIGSCVQRATVVEMGLYGCEDHPRFTHPDLKFVQASEIELFLTDSRVRLQTWQDNDQFAISASHVGLQSSSSVSLVELGPLFRRRTLHEFPFGNIQKVEWTCDERGTVQEVLFAIDGQTPRLKAGEVYEDLDGRISIMDRDESILIFMTDEAFQNTIFNERAYVVPPPV